MTYWYEVGVHPNPTEDDLPVIARWSDGSTTTHMTNVPPRRTVLGVSLQRWFRLPTETAPPPEEEGVEVEGCWWKVGSGPIGSGVDYVFAHAGTGVWSQMDSVDSYKRKAAVAIALGLVDPPVPADVQRVVDAAKAWRDRNSYFTANPAERDLITAVDALDSPAPVPADPIDGAERTAPPSGTVVVPADTSDPEPEPECGAEFDASKWGGVLSGAQRWCVLPSGHDGMHATDPDRNRAFQWSDPTSDPEPEPKTLRPIPPEWQEFNEELVEDLRDDEWVTCPSCSHDFTIDAEAGGRRIADAVTRLAMGYLTPTPSWPPMRPMSDLPPEPPIGSVVSDRDGDVWQRRDDGLWHIACQCASHRKWKAPETWEFVNDYMPTVLREGPAA